MEFQIFWRALDGTKTIASGGIIREADDLAAAQALADNWLVPALEMRHPNREYVINIEPRT